MDRPRERIYRLLGYKIVDRVQQYRLDMHSIATALETFHAYYGHYPNVKDSESALDNEVSNARVVAILVGKDGEREVLEQNPKGIRFLTLSSREQVEYRDPWGHPYHIAVSAKTNRTLIGNTVISSAVAIWSDGPNQLNERGQGDDLCSWK